MLPDPIVMRELARACHVEILWPRMRSVGAIAGVLALVVLNVILISRSLWWLILLLPSVLLLPIGEGVSDWIRMRLEGPYAYVANKLILAHRTGNPAYLAPLLEDPQVTILYHAIKDMRELAITAEVRVAAANLVTMWPPSASEE